VTSTSCAAGPPAADRRHSAHNAYQVQLCRPGGRYKRGIPAGLLEWLPGNARLR
jgi:hypothetical protein